MRALRITACWDAHWNFPSSSKSFRCQKQAARPSNSSSGHFKYDRNLRGWQHKKTLCDIKLPAKGWRQVRSSVWKEACSIWKVQESSRTPTVRSCSVLNGLLTMAALQKPKQVRCTAKPIPLPGQRADTVAAVRLAVQNRWARRTGIAHANSRCRESDRAS